MSVANPVHHIRRVTVAGEEAEFVKMFDPPRADLPGDVPLPEPLAPTNPVPEVMEALGLSSVRTPRTVQNDLLNGLDIGTWDGAKTLHFMTIRDGDLKSPFNSGHYPAATIRVPRGVIFHSEMQGKGPPPHTIHWHGIEPTPINDGVGHCSMELGKTTYQWQPNFIGSYFYHCHRNTMQHFEFGLFGNLFILPPDAYFASVIGANFQNQTLPATIAFNNIPIGACSDGNFRIAANTANFPQFPGFIGGNPTVGVANGDPHAFTVPYDVEAMWVLDDRDSVWSDLASDAFQTFPVHGDQPGVNDNFAANVTPLKPFFAFNDFNADYWFVTGVPVPAPRGGSATIDPVATFGGNGNIPPALNSGVRGTRVALSVNANRTILVRCLDAAYNSTHITFPVDVVIIAWDGRALGVPPFGLYNHAFAVPAGTPIAISTARRFDALIRTTPAMRALGNTFVKVEFLDTRGGNLRCTARIPFTVN